MTFSLLTREKKKKALWEREVWKRRSPIACSRCPHVARSFNHALPLPDVSLLSLNPLYTHIGGVSKDQFVHVISSSKDKSHLHKRVFLFYLEPSTIRMEKKLNMSILLNNLLQPNIAVPKAETKVMVMI